VARGLYVLAATRTRLGPDELAPAGFSAVADL